MTVSSTTLLTGWNGFLGSILCEAQERSNIEITRCGRVTGSDVICDLSKGSPIIPSHVTRVIHSAGLTPNPSRPHDSKNVFHEGNVTTTQHLLNGLNPLSLKSFVLISSVSVYGSQPAKLLTESAPLTPSHEYAKSKKAVEDVVRNWCDQHNVPYTIVRLPLIVAHNAPGSLGQLVNAIKSKRFVIPGAGDAQKSMVLATDVADWLAKQPDAHGIFNLTDQADPSYAQICDAITKHYSIGKVRRVPLMIMALASWVGEIGGNILNKRLPYNRSIHIQLTQAQTYSSQLASQHGWSPKTVLENKHVWLN